MSKRACKVHTRQGKCPIDNYSQRYLALLLPGSRPNARNSPGACPYCNRCVKKILRIEWNHENLLTRKFFTQIIFNVKISRSAVEGHSELWWCQFYCGMKMMTSCDLDEPWPSHARIRQCLPIQIGSPIVHAFYVLNKEQCLFHFAETPALGAQTACTR